MLLQSSKTHTLVALLWLCFLLELLPMLLMESVAISGYYYEKNAVCTHSLSADNHSVSLCDLDITASHTNGVLAGTLEINTMSFDDKVLAGTFIYKSVSLGDRAFTRVLIYYMESHNTNNKCYVIKPYPESCSLKLVYKLHLILFMPILDIKAQIKSVSLYCMRNHIRRHDFRVYSASILIYKSMSAGLFSGNVGKHSQCKCYQVKFSHLDTSLVGGGLAAKKSRYWSFQDLQQFVCFGTPSVNSDGKYQFADYVLLDKDRYHEDDDIILADVPLKTLASRLSGASLKKVLGLHSISVHYKRMKVDEMARTLGEHKCVSCPSFVSLFTLKTDPLTNAQKCQLYRDKLRQQEHSVKPTPKTCLRNNSTMTLKKRAPETGLLAISLLRRSG